METEPESSERTSAPSVAAATHGRELAVRALLAGPDCSQQRVSKLLGVSRRTIGRMVDTDLTTALRDPKVLEQAERVAATASRGRPAEEREAADAWLIHARRDEQQVEQFHQRTVSRRPRATVKALVALPAGKRNVKRPSVTPATHVHSSPGPPPVVFTRYQLHALTRQQQRILHRSALVDYVIATETRGGQPLALGDALGELLADITEAARTIGTTLQQAGDRRKA